MDGRRGPFIAASALVIGALLGMAGTFAPSLQLRSLAWGLDGIAIVVGCALLTVHHVREGHDQIAAGYLVFLAGQTLVASGAAMDLDGSVPALAAGAGLWSAGLLLVSTPSVLPAIVRITGAIAAILFGITALRIFAGTRLTFLSAPLPFYAFPFLAITLFGWAWAHVRQEKQ